MRSLNLLLINPTARRAFGLWQDEDISGKPVSAVLHHPELLSLLNEGRLDPQPHNEISFDDGRVLTAQYTLIPKIGVAVTMQDITYLKQIDRLKNEFVHTVSHDLRSPLTAILGYIDLLERVGPINDQQREFIHRVQAQRAEHHHPGERPARTGTDRSPVWTRRKSSCRWMGCIRLQPGELRSCCV